MIDINQVNLATDQCVSLGIGVLNAFLFAETEIGHVNKLLTYMNPPQNAVILDAGCGVGEVPNLMKKLRPDLVFKLLNISSKQLAMCDPDMEKIEADFNHIPLENESVDVVMFNYSICHSSDWLSTMIEAQRVLKEGGILFINDMSRLRGNNFLMAETLHANAHHANAVIEWGNQAGFVFDEGYFHTPIVNRLRNVFANEKFYDVIFDEIEPATWRFVKKTINDPIASAFFRHKKIAFQFSGGRDSTAALYLLKPYWDKLTVYHLDTGDQFPETIEVVKEIEKEVKNIVRIKSDVSEIRRNYGMASDLIPVDNTDVGSLVSGRSVKIIGRYECCARTLMWPMHKKVVEDGNTLIIRGQRDDEYAKPPLRSGEHQDGLEVLYPIQHWSGEQVSTYLEINCHPIAPYYSRGAKRAPECMGCTAWWDEGRADYLKKYHPDAYDTFKTNMKIIRIEINRQYQMLDY